MHGNNYVHLIGLLIVVGFSVLSWIFRQIQEQKAKKEARERQEKRELEILRTGRDPSTQNPHVSAEARRQRELALQREAQLAELRRRAQVRTQAQNAPVARDAARATPPRIPSATLRTIPGSTGPTVPERHAARATPLPPVKPQAKPPARPQPRPQARPQFRPQARPPQRPPQPAKPPAAIKPQFAPTPEPPPMPQPASGRVSPLVNALFPRTPEEWRRAIIANEIMMPPIATRHGDAPVPF